MKLGDVLSVKHGYAFKSQFFSEAGPYVLLTPGSFYEEGGFRDQADKTKYYTGDFDGQWILVKGDLIVAMTEQAEGLLGSSALIPEPNKYLHNQRLGLIAGIDDSQADRNYLYYLFNTREVRAQISASASGTKVRHTSPSRICQVDVDLPPVSIQRRIADILSAYDDLIENNRRRMALLEDAARMIYREWFVRLRFPGHETTRIVDGVPEGWRKYATKDTGQVVTGKTPSTSIPENYGGSTPFVKTPDMHGNVFVVDTSAKLTQRGADTQKNKFIPAGSIMVSCIGTIGVVSIASEQCQTNQQINSLIPLDANDTYYCYHALKSLKDAMEALGGGATMPNVNKNKFECLEVLWPSANLRADFSTTCGPMFEQILNLQKQNQKLQQARDILLPKLMSGEIEVSETADTIEKELVAVQ